MTCSETMKRLDPTSSVTEFRALSSDAAVRQHLAGCPACRRQFAAAARLWQYLDDWARLAESLPEDVVEEGRRRTMAAIASGQRSSLPASVLPRLYKRAATARR